ncbi:Crp/Fnr family transcriptional regulator [Rapidithrix thailandica]|uniref:Crp/Fnr family transcriptional regulator n=1 Tax=Rapidithrix thailandica TaxID=413964 RepID=A0AAW9RT24_9BACT
MMKSIRNLIIHQAGLPEERYEQLVVLLKPVQLQKKEYLIRDGNTCSFLGFVEDGLLRSFIYKDTDEFNIDFYLPGTVVSAYTSFLSQTPTHGFIQALSDTQLHTLSYWQFQQLLQSSSDWYRFGKYLSDQFFMRKCKRESSLLKDPAKERYELLLQMYPDIEQRVAQYHIASYLGIKAESLSRIKALTYIKK